MAASHYPSNGRMIRAPFRQWDGAVPILMSITVLLMIAAELIRYGAHAPRHDEGTSDHIAIMLMFGQIPIMLWFVATRRHSVTIILPVLVTQLTLWSITFVLAVTLT